MPRRLAFALALLCAVGASACSSGESAVGMDWQAGAGDGPDSTGAAALFAHFADGTVNGAFARLAERPYTVTVTLADLDPAGAQARPVRTDTLGVFQQILEVSPGAAPRVTRTTASGTLADSADLDSARLLPANPLPALITGDAPFLDPRTRGAYRLDRTKMGIGRVLALSVADASADRPLIRRATVEDLMDDRLGLGVQRTSRSAIYDETSAARVLLKGWNGDPYLPHEVRTSFQTATPGRRRWLVTRWDIQPRAPSAQDEAVQDSTMNSREP